MRGITPQIHRACSQVLFRAHGTKGNSAIEHRDERSAEETELNMSSDSEAGAKEGTIEKISQKIDEIEKEIALIGERYQHIDPSGDQFAGHGGWSLHGTGPVMEQLDWFLRQYIELLHDIHGDNLFNEKPELVRRIRMLGPDYVKCFLPSDMWEDTN